MELFDIEAGKIILNPNSLYVPEFRKIWDRDKTVGKHKAMDEIAYVTFLCSYNSKNPYNAYSHVIKETKVRKDTIDREPDKLIKDAILRYRELQKTASSKLVENAIKAADVLADYFGGVKKEDAGEIIRNMERLGGVVKTLESLKNQLRKEQLEAASVRGGAEIGPYEIPKVTKEDD